MDYLHETLQKCRLKNEKFFPINITIYLTSYKLDLSSVETTGFSSVDSQRFRNGQPQIENEAVLEHVLYVIVVTILG